MNSKGIKVVMIVCALLVLRGLNVLAEESYDFKSTNWGMTKQQVKVSENSALIEERDKVIFYNVKVAGFDAVLGYEFVENKLCDAMYIFIEEHSNETQYINDFFTLKELLTDKYKEPIIDDIVWKNDLYRNDPQYYGLAVSIGHLSLLSKWETENTMIDLILWGDNFEINMGLRYASKELYPLKEQSEQSAKSNDL